MTYWTRLAAQHETEPLIEEIINTYWNDYFSVV